MGSEMCIRDRNITGAEWKEGVTMTATDRRLEIISILVVSGHTTSKELAQEFGVTKRTILNDVTALTYGYPIYTKQGACGGIFIMDSYKPNRTITHSLP